MTFRNIKLFIGISLFLVYVSIGVFGLLKFDHTPETSMANCPFTENGFSVCGNSFNHINNWRQFSNTTLQVLFIFSFLVLGIILYFFNKQNFLN